MQLFAVDEQRQSLFKGQILDTRHSLLFLQRLGHAAKGLDLVLDSKGRELLQYVAPARFDALRAPLLAQAAGSTPGKP